MLQITIPATVREDYDDVNNEFVYVITEEEQTLRLEHSLLSLSKWESKWCKSFLHSKDKTDEEILDYVKCMTLDSNVDSSVYDRLTQANLDDIHRYIAAPMTATTFSDDKNKKASREIVTAELIYYWMVSLNIPFKCERWHLNRLITLVRVCNIKNTPSKKSNKRDTASKYARMNAARKSQLHKKG